MTIVRHIAMSTKGAYLGVVVVEGTCSPRRSIQKGFIGQVDLWRNHKVQQSAVSVSLVIGGPWRFWTS
jgi:hypothetical protein